MKSCLRLPSAPSTPTPDCIHRRKCVAFCAEGSEEVFVADEWDRTPAEPAQKLSYQDILELKAIKRSLPTAAQAIDPLSSRPQTQLLRTVPIALVPLVPETQSCRQTDTSPVPSSSPSHIPPFQVAFKARSSSSAVADPWQPFPRRGAFSSPICPKPRFPFLPLLDTPPSSKTSSPISSSPERPSSPQTFAEFEAALEAGEDILHHAPPTPTLTNAILDSPIFRASSNSPEPKSFLHPPPRALSPISDSDEHKLPSSNFHPSHASRSHALPSYAHDDEVASESDSDSPQWNLKTGRQSLAARFAKPVATSATAPSAGARNTIAEQQQRPKPQTQPRSNSSTGTRGPMSPLQLRMPDVNVATDDTRESALPTPPPEPKAGSSALTFALPRFPSPPTSTPATPSYRPAGVSGQQSPSQHKSPSGDPRAALLSQSRGSPGSPHKTTRPLPLTSGPTPALTPYCKPVGGRPSSPMMVSSR